MRARVSAESPYPNVRACVGREFVRDSWTELPDSFLEEVSKNKLLEIEGAKPVVEPDEVVAESANLLASNFDILLAGNASTVKQSISSMQDIPELAAMLDAETEGKRRKGVLIAIEDRLAEIESGS
jgi:hypothetical protein